MESQFRPVIRQKIIDAQAAVLPVLTRRDVWLPLVKNKATAVIGMRRAGKTSLLLSRPRTGYANQSADQV